MNGLIQGIGPFLAVIAALTGLVAAISQFTLRQRMSRTAEWAREAQRGQENTFRIDVLQQVEIWTTGYALAAVLVPIRVLRTVMRIVVISAAVVFTIGSVDFFLSNFVYKMVAPLETAEEDVVARTIILLTSGFGWCVGILYPPILGAAERHRIAAQFFQGKSVKMLRAEIRPPAQDAVNLTFVQRSRKWFSESFKKSVEYDFTNITYLYSFSIVLCAWFIEIVVNQRIEWSGWPPFLLALMLLTAAVSMNLANRMFERQTPSVFNDYLQGAPD